MNSKNNMFDMIRQRSLPIENFKMFWRFKESPIEISSSHMAQIKVVTKDDAVILDKIITVDWQLQKKIPFTDGVFSKIDSLSLAETSDQDKLISLQNDVVKNWLKRRPVPFKQHVFLSYEREVALTTTWEMVQKYWSIFYYPIADDLTVFDRTGSWALLFEHNFQLFFGSKKQ